jgi:sarcosine oxidase, subunit beta
VTERFEVVVVGAGVIGLAVARRLRELGASALVVERTGIGAGASGVQPGGVRLQWGTAVNCRLARESFAFWQEFPERLRRCGYMFVAHSEHVLARLADNVALQNAEGIPSRIVGPAEAAELVPGLRTATLAGAAWCGEDGYFDRPQAVVEAFAQGTEVRIGTVTALEPDGAGWALVLAGGERLVADAVVVAAGAESAPLVAPLGVTLPIEREGRYLFYSEPVRERLVEPLVVSAELRFAAKQLADGRVLASDLAAAGDPDASADAWRRNVRAAIRELLPVLEYVAFPLLVPGEYDVTPDRQPILGPVPDFPGLHVAAGFSGHGFMLAPAVARLVGDAVAGVHDPVLETLGPARFAAGRLVPEPAVV